MGIATAKALIECPTDIVSLNLPYRAATRLYYRVGIALRVMKMYIEYDRALFCTCRLCRTSSPCTIYTMYRCVPTPAFTNTVLLYAGWICVWLLMCKPCICIWFEGWASFLPCRQCSNVVVYSSVLKQ